MGPCSVFCSNPCPRIQSTEDLPVAVSYYLSSNGGFSKPFQHCFKRPTSNLTIALASASPTNLPSTPAFPGSCNEVQNTELPTSSLNSLENLAPPLWLGVSPAQNTHLLSTLGGGRGGGGGGGGGPSPEAYLVGNQQAWLALRLHQHPRWHLPFFSCLRTSPEP